MSQSEPTTCPFCTSAVRRHRWQKKGFQFYQCGQCDLIFLHPMPSEREIASYYEEDFFSADSTLGYQDYEAEQQWRGRNYERDIRHMQEVLKGGRILDVGCATGHFLDAMPDSWDTYGLEVSEYAGQEARKRYGDRIRIAALQDSGYPDSHFDAVTLWETINHMADPMGDMAEVQRILKPGGYVFISVGDYKTFLARLMGRYWYHVTPPIHLYYFTPKTMTHIFDRQGFEWVWNRYPGKYINLAGCLERIKDISMSPWFTTLCRRAARLPGMRAMLYINLMDTMYCCARKRDPNTPDQAD